MDITKCPRLIDSINLSNLCLKLSIEPVQEKVVEYIPKLKIQIN